MEKEPNLNSAEKPRKLNSREFFEEKKKKKASIPPLRTSMTSHLIK